MKFNVTSSDGRQISVEGNQAPSEQELNQIFSYIPAVQTQQPEQKSLGGFIGNVGKSAGNLVASTASAIVNPVETVKNLISAVKDPQTLIDYYKNRYGKDLTETLYSDPVGVLADLSTVVGGAGAIAKGVGTVSKLGKVGQVADTLSNVSRATDPFRAVTKTAGKIGDVISDTSIGNKLKVSNIGQKIEQSGKDFTKKGYGQNSTVAKFEDKYRPVSDVITEYGLYGKNTDKLDTVLNSLQNEFDDIAKKSGRTANANDLLGKISDKIDELNNSGFVEDKSLAKALSARTQELIKSGKLSNVNDVGELTTLRKGFDKRIGTYATDATKKGANQLMREALTNTVRDATGDLTTPSGNTLQQTGNKLSELYAFKPIIKQASQRGQTSRAFPLGKVATTTTGGIAAGPVGAVVGYVADSFANSPKGSELISKGLQSTGKALQGINTPKVPSSVSNIVKNYANVSKAGRMTNLPYQQSSEQKTSTTTPVVKSSAPNTSTQTTTQVNNPKISTKNNSYNPFKKVTVKRGSYN